MYLKARQEIGHATNILSLLSRTDLAMGGPAYVEAIQKRKCPKPKDERSFHSKVVASYGKAKLFIGIILRAKWVI
jgi:hypothetical protein